MAPLRLITMRYSQLALVVICWLCASITAVAQNAAPEKPGAQELELKNGRKISILWDEFKLHKFHLYMKGDTACINNERLIDQTPDVRQIVQWAAEEQGIRVDVEQHLEDSIKQPLGLRIVAAKPLVLELQYATGTNIGTGRAIALPLCAVDSKDQQLMWNAANQMKAFRDYERRENRRVRAAEDTADAAWRAAWAAEDAADNTQRILDGMGY